MWRRRLFLSDHHPVLVRCRVASFGLSLHRRATHVASLVVRREIDGQVEASEERRWRNHDDEGRLFVVADGGLFQIHRRRSRARIRGLHRMMAPNGHTFVREEVYICAACENEIIRGRIWVLSPPPPTSRVLANLAGGRDSSWIRLPENVAKDNDDGEVERGRREIAGEAKMNVHRGAQQSRPPALAVVVAV